MNFVESPMFAQSQGPGQEQDIETKGEAWKRQGISLCTAMHAWATGAVHIRTAIAVMGEAQDSVSGDNSSLGMRTGTRHSQLADRTEHNFRSQIDSRHLGIVLGRSHEIPLFARKLPFLILALHSLSYFPSCLFLSSSLTCQT